MSRQLPPSSFVTVSPCNLCNNLLQRLQGTVWKNLGPLPSRSDRAGSVRILGGKLMAFRADSAGCADSWPHGNLATSYCTISPAGCSHARPRTLRQVAPTQSLDSGELSS